MATSAVCLTGLTVVNPQADLTLMGQLVLLILVQAGGLGYMAITTVVAVALGKQLSIQERLTLQESFNIETLDGLSHFILSIFKLTLTLELIGAALLTARWAMEYDLGHAVYLGIFHSVMSFNNAGFSLFPHGMTTYRDDLLVNTVITFLVICGGLGFVVLNELKSFRSKRNFSVHTKLVLSMSGGLILFAFAAIYLLEYRNPLTLGALNWKEGLLASCFHAVSPRTSGFNTLDVGAMYPATLFMIIILMFIGTAPGGTGGGIKITTFSITVATIWAMVRGRSEPTIMHRRIPSQLVARSFSICLISFLAMNIVVCLLLVTETQSLLPTLFEATSAFSTVGLSMGQEGSALSLSAGFSTSGKILLAAMMFMGRVGSLTLAVAIARGGRQPLLRYPEGKILVG